MKDSVTVTTTTTVNEETIVGLLACGFEGGVNYWLRIEDYIEPETVRTVTTNTWNFGEGKVFKHIDYPLSEGGGVVCRDMESGEEHTLDGEAIRRGVQIMARDCPHHWQDVVRDSTDATTGDVFIQCCLLGKLVYG